MKLKFTTLFISISAIVLSGCSDNFVDQRGYVSSGEEIRFIGEATYSTSNAGSSAGTRTIYTGVIENNKEGVQWIKGDKIRVYCPEAAGTNTSDYVVAATNEAQETGAETAGLTRIDPNVSLQWGSSSTHNFYAVYPSPEQYLGENILSSDVLTGSASFKGYLPKDQQPLDMSVVTQNELNAYTAKPNMKYAYMVAHNSVSSSNQAEDVLLQFNPVMTAVEITLVNKSVPKSSHWKDENNVEHVYPYPNGQSFSLVSAEIGTINNTPLYGEFSYAFDNGQFTTDNSKNSTNTTISVSLAKDGSPIRLNVNESIKFTFFMLPTVDLDNLVISLRDASGVMTGKISGINIQAKKKNYLYNVPISPSKKSIDYSDWMKDLPDQASKLRLSIPGAGGASSGNKNSSNQYLLADEYREQNISIEDMWNRGIRAFEFAVNRNSSETGQSLGSNTVTCNGEITEISLEDAVDLVKTQLCKHPTEFAMVIVTYQPDGNWRNVRDANEFMRQLSAYWETVKSGTWTPGTGVSVPEGITLGTALYTPDMTVKDSRGKLFCIARPTSKYENDNSDQTDDYVADDEIYPSTYIHEHILCINGWGSLKDKWEARGFSHDMMYGTDNKDASYRLGRPVTTSNRNNITTFTYNYWDLTPNYVYGTQTHGNTPYEKGAWIQEWSRVSPENAGIIQSGGTYYYWAPSYQEKLEAAKQCLDYSINHTQCDIANNLHVTYINSLCGYFVDQSIDLSFQPYGYKTGWVTGGTDHDLSGCNSIGGMGGNIEAFSKQINEDFYHYLLDRTSGYVPGPMGIILMDRVSDDIVNNEPGYNLPGIVIANNFRHNITPDDSEGGLMPTTRGAAAGENKKEYHFEVDMNN